jgi:hypothetical protein
VLASLLFRVIPGPDLAYLTRTPSERSGVQDEALQAVVLLREEMQQPRPNAGKVSQLLGRIMTRVAPVATLLDLVTQVKDLVAPLLH